MRGSRLVFEPIKMKPTEIRRIRTRLLLSQPEFANFLCASVGTVGSWGMKIAPRTDPRCVC